MILCGHWCRSWASAYIYLYNVGNRTRSAGFYMWKVWKTMWKTCGFACGKLFCAAKICVLRRFLFCFFFRYVDNFRSWNRWNFNGFTVLFHGESCICNLKVSDILEANMPLYGHISPWERFYYIGLIYDMAAYRPFIGSERAQALKQISRPPHWLRCKSSIQIDWQKNNSLDTY